MATPVIVDDRNPQIVYTGAWAAIGGQGNFNTTLHSVPEGVSSSASFRFSGSLVAVLGTLEITGTSLRVQPPWSSYNLDGGANTTFIPDYMLAKQFSVPFYQSQPLSPGEHTLNIYVHGRGPLGSPFFLDYIKYTPFAQTAPNPILPPSPDRIDSISSSNPGPTAPTSISASASSMAVTAPTATENPTVSSPTQNSTSNISNAGTSYQGTYSSSIETSTFSPKISASIPASNSSKARIGAIVGGVLGIVFFSIIIFALLLYWRRRKPRDRQSSIYPYRRTLSASMPSKFAEKSSGIISNDYHHWSLLAGPSNIQDAITPVEATTNDVFDHHPHSKLLNGTNGRPNHLSISSETTLIASNTTTGVHGI